MSKKHFSKTFLGLREIGAVLYIKKRNRCRLQYTTSKSNCKPLDILLLNLTVQITKFCKLQTNPSIFLYSTSVSPFSLHRLSLSSTSSSLPPSPRSKVSTQRLGCEDAAWGKGGHLWLRRNEAISDLCWNRSGQGSATAAEYSKIANRGRSILRISEKHHKRFNNPFPSCAPTTIPSLLPSDQSSNGGRRHKWKRCAILPYTVHPIVFGCWRTHKIHAVQSCACYVINYSKGVDSLPLIKFCFWCNCST